MNNEELLAKIAELERKLAFYQKEGDGLPETLDASAANQPEDINNDAESFINAHKKIGKMSIEEIRQRDAILNAIFSINIHINKLQPAADMMEKTLAEAVSLLNADSGIIVVSTGSELQVKASYGLHSSREAGDLLKKAEPVIFGIKTSIECFKDHKMSCLVSQLSREGRIVGCIFLHREKKGHFFTKIDQEFLEIFASHVSLALNNSLLFNRTRLQNKELKRMIMMKNHFIEHLSKDLKKPLDDIKEFLSTPSEDSDSNIKRAIIIIDWLQRTIDKVLSITALQKETEEMYAHVVKIDVMVDEIIVALEPQIKEKDLQVLVDVEDGVSSIEGNKDIFYTILDEVICNGVVYNKKSGSLTITARKEDSQIFIEVTDTGMGIKKEDKEKVFERFFRSPDSYDIYTRGAGLGLYIVKSFIESYGGLIKIKSEPGEGTTIILQFPA